MGGLLFLSPLLISLFLLLPVVYCSSCGPSDLALLALAFRSVSGFQLPPPSTGHDCSLRLPSRHLSGSVGWMYLRNTTNLRALDLSGNVLEGSVPGGFWSSPALEEVNLAGNRLGGAIRFQSSPVLRSLNLSGNRFSSAVGFAGLRELEVLDLSRNALGLVPSGLDRLKRLKYLDVSWNSMKGEFPKDFPPMVGAGLRHLNVSHNNLSGVVEADVVGKYGISAFTKAGSLRFISSTSAASSPSRASGLPTEQKKRNGHGRAVKLGVIVAAASLVAALAVSCCIFFAARKRRRGRKEENKWEEKEAGSAASQEAKWVAEARAPAMVVMFEKPLMELTFADLAKATSGFGKESQLAAEGGGGGRSGPAYRAVLPGDMHVVVRMAEAARDVEERAAAAAFRELARLRHPNLLPLLGYCIPGSNGCEVFFFPLYSNFILTGVELSIIEGKEKLVLYEYMERGDLHRWLHELPSGQPDVEDWIGETWELPPQQPSGEERSQVAATAIGDWPTRHRIALGIARGLAFLHQGWVGSARSGVAHGHLVPTNVLLGDDLEPRVADFGAAAVAPSNGTVEGDVYDYGVVVMELVTGREGWSSAAVEWMRGAVRAGKAAELVDPRLRLAEPDEEKEAAECLRVGYLCTTPLLGKRPTMQQVVGLLKDARGSSTTSTSNAASAAASSSSI